MNFAYEVYLIPIDCEEETHLIGAFNSIDEAKVFIENEKSKYYNTTFELKQVSDGSIEWF